MHAIAMVLGFKKLEPLVASRGAGPVAAAGGPASRRATGDSHSRTDRGSAGALQHIWADRPAAKRNPAAEVLNVGPASSLKVNVTLVPDAGSRHSNQRSSIHHRLPCSASSRIYQTCPINAATVTDTESKLQAEAVTSVLNEYGLPSSATDMVMTYGRDDVRAALFAKHAGGAESGSQRTPPEQQAAIDVFGQRIKQTHLTAATVAQNEYTTWSKYPCGYTAPTGFA